MPKAWRMCSGTKSLIRLIVKGRAECLNRDIGGLQQRVLRQMAITLGRSDLCMAEKFLDFIQTTTAVDQKTGKRVAKIMNPYLR